MLSFTPCSLNISLSCSFHISLSCSFHISLSCSLCVYIKLHFQVHFCVHLKHLTLKNAWLPYGKIKIEHFPSSLTHLSLIGCKVYHRLFENSESTLPNLEYLRVEDVKHFCEVNYVAFKKLKNIKSLILRKCSGSFRVSPQFREEFPRLKVLDLSESGTAAGLCSYFYLLPLRELSLSCRLKGFVSLMMKHWR